MYELESMSPVDDAWRIPDSLWQRIKPVLPEEQPHPEGGRPYTPARQWMDGIFYVLRTGCQWKTLPKGWSTSAVPGCVSSLLCRSGAGWREAT